jgi:hypothetical protein
METVSNGLKYLFTYILYPCVLLGFFASICYLIYKIVKDAEDLNEMIRRIAAAALPIISLVFLIIAVDSKDSSNLKKFILSLNEFFKFLVGLVVGVDIVEAGRFFFKSQKEIWMSIYAIFLSSVLAFILYMLMLGGLGSLQFFLFGMVLAGIVLLVFHGLPGSKSPSFSKFSIALILILNLAVFAAPILISGWVFKSIPVIVTPPVIQKHEEVKSPEINYREQSYIDLIKWAVGSDKYEVNFSGFMRGIKGLKAMGSYHKIPIPLVIDALRKTYPNTDNEYPGRYREIAIEAISFLVDFKVKEACKLLSEIETKGGFLSEPARDAIRKICGY